MIVAESHQIIQQIMKYNILNKNKISAWFPLLKQIVPNDAKYKHIKIC